MMLLHLACLFYFGFLLIASIQSLTIKSQNETYEGIDLSKSRIEINEFLSQEEASKCISLINSFGLLSISPGVSTLRIDEIVAHFMKYGSHVSQQSSSFSSSSASSKGGNPKKTVYAPQLRNDKWVSAWITASTRIKDIIDAYFGATFVLSSGYLLRHHYVHTPSYKVRYPGVNVSEWATEPHSDHCTVVLDSQHGFHCNATPVRAFDTAAIVYLNHVHGGNSIFIDVPFGRPGLSNATAGLRHAKLVFDVKVADLNKVVQWSIPTVIKTEMGKLLFYDSTIDTLHGTAALKQQGEVRDALVFYFKKKI